MEGELKEDAGEEQELEESLPRLREDSRLRILATSDWATNSFIASPLY